jgi:phosphatidylethanolamine/phosphatidyl-N-methylethanolamine N-methyltransferase
MVKLICVLIIIVIIGVFMGHSLNRDLCVSSPESLAPFFAGRGSSVVEIITEKCARIWHFITSGGVWINKKNLCAWVFAHRTDTAAAGVVGSFTDSRYKGLYRRLVRAKEGLYIPQKSAWQSAKETATFFKEFVRHPTVVGSLCPSSNHLAKSIVRMIPQNSSHGPRSILEIGPGSGAFTDRIIKRMNPGDTLTLVEFDKTFAAALRAKYATIPGVTVIEGDILAHDPDVRYDFVISGLPLNGFKADFVGKFFKKVKAFTKLGGKFSYFEYYLIPDIKKLFLSQIHKKELDDILKLKKEFYLANWCTIDPILRNMTPARVRHHQIRAGLNSALVVERSFSEGVSLDNCAPPRAPI